MILHKPNIYITITCDDHVTVLCGANKKQMIHSDLHGVDSQNNCTNHRWHDEINKHAAEELCTLEVSYR